MSTAELIAKIDDEIEGEVFSDALHRGVYATDASIYQVIPSGVIYPRSADDVVKIMRFASEHEVPVLARGGATSLAGQTVTPGLVLDFTRHMHEVIEYDPAGKWIKVQPGITRDEVNSIASADGLIFAPDPATSSRATIGGMIANNSSGTKSILYGKTIDHVLELTVLLTDGSIHQLKPGNTNGSVFTRLKQLVFENKSAIVEGFPKTMRRVNGYCLDELIEDDPWHPYRLFVGSEGTLGVILNATIKLVDLPAAKGIGVVQFSETINAVRAVRHMLPFHPAAIEILSDVLLDYSKKNLATQAMTGWIKGWPASVQIVEFYGKTDEEIAERAQAMFVRLREEGLGFAFDFFPEGPEYNNVWSIRKKGLGLLMGEPKDRRGIAFIEDAAVPVEQLPEYIEDVLDVCSKYNIKATYYAHASVGVIHVRPLMDLRQAGDIEKMKAIAAEVFELVKKYGGAWSGEHGDGRVRSPFLKSYFGEELYGLLVQVKQMFDPKNILNPGTIIDPPPMDENLRYGTSYRDSDLSVEYRYPEQKSFHTAVHQCTGIGACRKLEGGTMCPSYMVTREEIHSTRGRANALRLAMSGQLGNGTISDPALMEAMDLCLSCKACKSECPSSVDMARLKSEVLQAHYDAHGIALRDRLIRDSAKLAARVSGPFAGIVNRVQTWRAFKRIVQSVAGIDARRTLPSYASLSFEKWFAQNYSDAGHERRVGLFADTYMNYHEPAIGRAAVRVIQALGYDIDLLTGCCQRPRISHGFLREARDSAAPLSRDIRSYDGTVIACEPGCVSALTDDLPDLLADIDAGAEIRSKVVPVEIWVADACESMPHALRATHDQLFLHGHCHQKALYSTRPIHRIFSLAGADIYETDSGCCGMGGSFGYEKEHYEVSKALTERVLLKDLRRYPHARVVAPGFSCRHQISHFGGREVVHWLEALQPVKD